MSDWRRFARQGGSTQCGSVPTHVEVQALAFGDIHRLLVRNGTRYPPFDPGSLDLHRPSPATLVCPLRCDQGPAWSIEAELKREIASGDVSATEAILSRRWETEAMPVVDVLTSQRQWGDRRCRRLLTAMQLQERKTIGSMTERQRLDMAARLNGSL